jgi:hypothetical protein
MGPLPNVAHGDYGRPSFEICQVLSKTRQSASMTTALGAALGLMQVPQQQSGFFRQPFWRRKSRA